MAYARMGNGSDVYLFGSKDALELYIANNKGSAGNVPIPKKGAPVEEWDAWVNDVKPFDHPECGKSYKFTSRKACLDKLDELWKSGVVVPQHCIDRLRDELAEEGDEYSVG